MLLLISIPHTPSLYLFILAALILNLTPGPDMIYVATRSASQGLKGGIISALGIFSGCLVHISFALFGISIILQRSATAFLFIKYLGAAYLVYLGIIALFQGKNSRELGSGLKKERLSRLYLQSVMTNVLNPKVALFFLAFLPQFVHPHPGRLAWEILGLGIYFDIQGTLILFGVAFLMSRIGKALLQRSRTIRNVQKLTGLILIGLGIRLALLDRK